MENSIKLGSTNISTFNNLTEEDDFFEELYTNTKLKQATIVTFLIGTILGLILEAGIIWYEKNGNHRYRTVINQLFATISWFVVVYILFVYIPDGIRYLSGPLNITLCGFHIFLKNCLVNCVVLALDAITALRYFFVFKLSNFGVVNDDLIATFLQITIVLLSIWMTTVKMMSVGKMPLNYYMCAGINPGGNNEETTDDQPTIHKFDTATILVLISAISNIFVFVKIFLYKRKLEKSTQNIELGRIQPFGNDAHQRHLMWLADKENAKKKNTTMPKSMADLTTQILCMVFLIIPQMMISVTINKVGPAGVNEYQNRWLVYYIQIISTALSVTVISIQYYIKNSHLPKAIWRNVKEKISCLA